MDFYFLSASVPFAKTITPNSVIPYPHIAIVSSHHKTADSIEEFYTHLSTHAEQGHCLLKGQLERPLDQEPRAGITDAATLTEWIVFDIDGLKTDTAEGFIACLPKAFHEASYIEQLSSTAYLNGNGYKAHLFFLIQPTIPRAIKDFILKLNLTAFPSQITLGTGNLCLNYPLDIQVNNNSTPLYIAPPTFIDRLDPIKTRIHLITKTNIRPTIDEVNRAHLKNLQQERLQELRQDVGLRGKQPKVTQHGTIDLLDNIEPMNTPAIRYERGFAYLALNPNNPHCYYHPIDNPNIIYNFKGEPAFLTRKGLPDYWKTVRAQQITKESEEKTPLLFRVRAQDTYYNGYKTKDGFDLSPCKSTQRLAHFALNNGYESPEAIPDWEMLFDPTDLREFNINEQRINWFVPSPLLRHCIDTNPSKKEIPPTIRTILESITGSDETCYNHFLNWLAFIFQTRKKTGTAWVFQGVEGTGKGLLYRDILKPLFGSKYCQEKTTTHLADQFNSWLENCIMLFVDESKIYGKSKREQIPNLLKNLITESDQTLRLMRSNPYLTENFTNVIFATNDGDALEISASDRRYNVCPEQTQALIVPLDIKEIIADEIEQFAEFLWSYPTDEKSARTALNNQAKQLMHESRLDDFGSFARSLIRGRFSSFYDIYVAAIGADQEHGIYKNTLNNWAKRQKESKDGTTYLRNDELRFVFQYITGREVSIISFGKYMKKYRVEFERFRDGDRVRCFKVRWQEGLDDLLSITV